MPSHDWGGKGHREPKDIFAPAGPIRYRVAYLNYSCLPRAP